MTRAVPILAALAVLVAIARLARRPKPLPSTSQAPDDSDIVGMPTFVRYTTSTVASGDGTFGPYWSFSVDPRSNWYVTVAPTSRN